MPVPPGICTRPDRILELLTAKDQTTDILNPIEGDNSLPEGQGTNPVLNCPFILQSDKVSPIVPI